MHSNWANITAMTCEVQGEEWNGLKSYALVLAVLNAGLFGSIAGIDHLQCCDL
jgi:hypothetical protein